MNAHSKTKEARRTANPVIYLSAAIALLALVIALFQWTAKKEAIRTQRQNDPAVADVWLERVTYGPLQHFDSRPLWARLANRAGISLFTGGGTVTNRYMWEPAGVELWFRYRSHIPGVALLECHRVGQTAFTDDLGQPYHGTVDFQDDLVGVYLPGYDHAARRLTCTVRWMPRGSQTPHITSKPMTFNVDLPRVSRRLFVPHTNLPVSAVKGGATVTLSEVRLGAPLLTGLREGQRTLNFRLGITGGRLACNNVAGYTGTITRHPGATGPLELRIEDPYGISILSPFGSVAAVEPLSKGKPAAPTLYSGDITGAGRGTDCVMFRFAVRNLQGTVVHFDMAAPVQLIEAQ